MHLDDIEIEKTLLDFWRVIVTTVVTFVYTVIVIIVLVLWHQEVVWQLIHILSVVRLVAFHFWVTAIGKVLLQVSQSLLKVRPKLGIVTLVSQTRANLKSYARYLERQTRLQMQISRQTMRFQFINMMVELQQHLFICVKLFILDLHIGVKYQELF